MIQIRNDSPLVKPLKEPVMYQLLNVASDPLNPGQNIVNSRSGVLLNYSYAKPGTGELVEYQYIDRTINRQTADGKMQPVDITDEHWFVQGIFTVPPHKPGIAFMMDNSPENASNPDRPQNKPAKYRRIDAVAEGKEALTIELQAIEAMSKVVAMDDKELIEFASLPQISLNPNQDKSVLRLQLINKVKAKPSLIIDDMVSTNSEAARVIDQGLDCKAIVYYKGARQYLWYNDNTPMENRILLKVDAGVEPKVALIRYVNENKEVLIPKIKQAIEEVKAK